MIDFYNLQKCRDVILDWFQEHRENFFFRENRNPYRVWISEVFLQQTRVNGALLKLENFLKIFPDVKSLAAAEEGQVMLAFKGMGYYNRARNLLKAAKVIQNNTGMLPTSYEELMKIPSIGNYTAAAIASICHGLPVLAVDGNIRRIFARIFKIDFEIQSRNFSNVLQKISLKLFENNPAWPGDINEALMQFGQKVCASKSPACEQCDINKLCLSNLQGVVEKYPIIKKKSDPLEMNWKLHFIIRSDKVLMQKYSNFYFLKNQYGFPSVLENLDSGEVISSMNTGELIRNNKEEFSAGVKHTITHHKINFYYKVSYDNDAEFDGDDLLWLPMDQVSALLISSGLQKTWDIFFKSLCARGGT